MPASRRLQPGLHVVMLKLLIRAGHVPLLLVEAMFVIAVNTASCCSRLALNVLSSPSDVDGVPFARQHSFEPWKQKVGSVRTARQGC